MSPPVANAKITLSCPLYAADFDPKNNGFLLVGGGGGEGRSGVDNKITLLDTSKKQELSEVVDIELSRDEDSVTSLAYAQSTDVWATAFAGINSSMKEQEQGRNQHLRSFLLEYPTRRRITAEDADLAQERASEYKGQTKALGKVSYFTPSTSPRPETFQRILRLSKKRKENGPRLGAVATGLATEGEVVIFAADTSSPSVKDVRGRIKLDAKEEAADVDITAFSDSKEDDTNFQIAYCTDYDIFITKCNYDYNRSERLDPLCIHSNPYPDVFASSKARPKFRSLRFLTPTLLLLLQNMPNGAGSELLLMDTRGQTLLHKRSLHKKIKSGTALSVAALPFQSPSRKGRKQMQHAIAVAGADTSITILTLDHTNAAPYTSLQFRNHLFLPSVHPTSITSLTFSTHDPPSTPRTQTSPQHLKLASTSIANTCVVHTFPLTPYAPDKKGSDTVTHYILSVPGARSSMTENAFSALVALLAIGIGAFFLQAFTEIRGGTPEILGAKGWLNERWHGWLARPYMLEDAVPTVPSKLQEAAQTTLRMASEAAEKPIETFHGAMNNAGERMAEGAHRVEAAAASVKDKSGLREMLRQRNMGSDTSDAGNDGKEIIVHRTADERGDTALSAQFREAETLLKQDSQAKRWEDLGHHERESWKRRLIDAGEWTVEEGESVLQGVFFSGLAAAVGAAVGG